MRGCSARKEAVREGLPQQALRSPQQVLYVPLTLAGDGFQQQTCL